MAKAWSKKAEQALRQRVYNELRDQGFDVLPQLQLPHSGVWFHGKFYNFDDIDPSRWGYPSRHELFSEKKFDAEPAPALSYTLNEAPEALFLPPGRQRQTTQGRAPHPHGRRQGLLRPNQRPVEASRHDLPPLPPIHARNLTAPGLSSTATNQKEVPKGNRGSQTSTMITMITT